MKANPVVTKYFIDGCGRCKLGGTPACKVHNWDQELDALRTIILAFELKEELKWGVPCYTLHGKNVLILSALKDCCLVSFFKGALINDYAALLEKPGPNTHAERVIRFRSLQDVERIKDILENHIKEAIAIEQSGAKIQAPNNSIQLPPEFHQKLQSDPVLKTAFESLTPGRQKGYALFFSAPKQPGTRESRIQKCIPLILMGKGLND